MARQNLPHIPLCDSCGSSFTQSTLLPNTAQSVALLTTVRTNHFPGPQIATLRAVIDAAPAELARYDVELSRLKAISEQIMAAREALRTYYEQCVCIVQAPIRRLPTEIILEIFRHCVANEVTVPPTLEPVSPYLWENEAKAELRRVAGGAFATLADVCVGWRRIVHGTPTLWSNITLDMRCWTLSVETTRAATQNKQLVHLLNVALERGRQTPLTIRVSGAGECHPNALKLLARHAHRWRDVGLSLGCEMLRNVSRIGGNLPLLEKLVVIGLDNNADSMGHFSHYFASAPRLRRLEFYGPPATAGFPFEQLELCDYRAVFSENVNDFLSALARLPSGSDFYAQLHYEAIRAALPMKITHVESQVAQLDLESIQDGADDSYHALDALLGAVTLPKMQRLRIFGMLNPTLSSPVYWPHRAAYTMFVRSGSRHTLKVLSIGEVVITQVDLFACLAELPILEYLYISDQPTLPAARGDAHQQGPHLLITDSLLRAFVPIDYDPRDRLVPNLKTINLRTLRAFSDTALLDFVAGRLEMTEREDLQLECTVLWIPIPGQELPLSSETLELLDGWAEETNRLTYTVRDFDPEEDQ